MMTVRPTPKPSRFIPKPLNAYMFKKLFGDEEHKDRVIDLLNAFIPDQLRTPIRTVTFLDTDPDPAIGGLRESIVDLRCKDNYGLEYIVQMHVARYGFSIDQVQRYPVRAYIDRMGKGELYEGVKEVIYLVIADYVTLFPDKEEYKSDHYLLNKSPELDNKGKLFFTMVEMPKFRKWTEKMGLHKQQDPRINSEPT